MKKLICILTLVFGGGFIFAQEKFDGMKMESINGFKYFIIESPTADKTNKAWVWYAPTLKKLPGEHEKWLFDIFLKNGISIAGINVGETNGSPKSHETLNAFHKKMIELGFDSKPVLLGRSRGGFHHTSWATRNPDKLRAFAGIYPVLNLMSWPTQTSKLNTTKAWGMTIDEITAKDKELNPLYRASVLSKNKIPVFIVHGDDDKLVPAEDNVLKFIEIYNTDTMKVDFEMIKGEGHNYSEKFFKSERLADFVLKQFGKK